MTALNWKPFGFASAKACDNAGRIVGEYQYRAGLSEWDAWHERQHLGRFISEEYAKAAIVRASLSPGQQEEPGK